MEVVAIFLSVFVMTPVVAAIFGVLYWGWARDRQRLEAAWEGYARRRKYTFEPPSGEWPNRTAPTIRFALDGAAYRIEARGEESRVRTSVVARPAVAAFGELFVTRPGPLASPTADPEPLHGRLVVSARPAALAPRVLTGAVKRALLGFDLGGPLSLVYRHGDVTLGWAGGEENDARLDEAREVVRQVVEALAATSLAA